MNATMDQHDHQTSSGATETTPTRRGLLVGIAILAVIAAAAAVYFVRSGDNDGASGDSSPTMVAKFSGDGDDVTESFDVEEGWQIHWENAGKRFAFAIDGEKMDYGTVVNEKRAGSGITSPVGEGTFRLHVNAKGPWSIQVMQGQPPPADN